MIPIGQRRPQPAPAPTITPLGVLASLQAQDRRLSFLAEHLHHPTVSQGVADAVLEARDAIRAALHVQRQLSLGAEL